MANGEFPPDDHQFVDGTRVDRTGLLEARNPIVPRTGLQDPRAPSWADQVAARRRVLMAAYARRVRTGEDVAIPATTEDLTGRIYKYSRGADLTNDEMGYGERGFEVFCAVEGDALKEATRTIQRTKSGKQTLTPPGPQPTEGTTAEGVKVAPP